MVMKGIKGFIKFIKGFGQKTPKKICNFFKCLNLGSPKDV